MSSGPEEFWTQRRERWLSVTSKDVINVSRERLSNCLTWVKHAHTSLVLCGEPHSEPRYSVNHTFVNAEGGVKLGVVGVSSEVKEKFLRYWYQHEYDEFPKEELLRGRHE